MTAAQKQNFERDQVIAFRLDSQHLSSRLPPGSLIQAAGACGLQNTPPGSAELALHARIGGLAPGEVGAALTGDRRLLQAWSLRASPYLFPTGDAAVFTLGLLPADEPSIRAFVFGVEPALDQIGISAMRVVELTAQALLETLDQRALTKDELGVQLAGRVLPELSPEQAAAWHLPSWYAAGQSLGESVARFILPILALRGLCCHADRRGNKAYIQRTDQWLGSPIPDADPNQARAELVRRYLRCYGPSTAKHFAEWAGIGQAQAAQAWSLVEEDLVPVDFARRTTWLHRQDLPRLISPPQPGGVRLLPPGDPYLALRDRATLIPDKTLHPRVWQKSGNPGAVLTDGRVAALWRPEKKGQRLTLTIEALAALSPDDRSRIEDEAVSLAPFRGCKSVSVKF